MLMIKEDSKIAIKKGSKVTIKAGPLKGMTGVVNSVPRPGRFIVHIAFIAAGASVEIDAANLTLTSH